MKIALLHISDIHIHDKNCPILSRAEKICATIYTLLPDVSAVIILATGDIAYSGETSEYSLAKIFFNQLIDCIKKKVSTETVVNLICIPGNHDGKFKAETVARKSLIQSIRDGGAIDDSVITICTEPQENYFEFEKNFSSEFLSHSDPLWKQYNLNINNKSISISAINASWLSQVPEIPGTLSFPVKNYADLVKSSTDIRIALIHHPLNWYLQASYHPLRQLFRENFQIVMSGHEHVSNATIINDLSLGESLMLEAGALWPHHSTEESSFTVVKLDLDAERFAKVDFVWQDRLYIPTQGDAVWDSFVSLPKRKNEGFTISDNFKDEIEDIGATFTHPNKERLVLSDIFVFPDLIQHDSTEESPETLSSAIFANQVNKIGRIILRGDEQYGKTALLRTLFHRYFSAGYVPLYLTGKDVGTVNEEQFQRKLIQAVEQQYSKDCINSYLQLPKESKILLLDNMDRAGLPADALARILNFVTRHFDSAIVSVSERFELAEISSSKTVEAANQFSHYRILGFGFKLRTELIKKWLRIGQGLKDDELQQRLHDAQGIIDSVIGKGLVPTTAFNVIVLLQSLEVSAKGALANAGMAQYYEFLIRKSLLKAKLKSEQLDEIFSYLSNLAWHFHTKKTDILDEMDISNFNKEFSSNILNTEFLERMEFLIQCRVLTKTGNTYSFLYPYIKYFFSAKYIADNLEENESLREIVLHACRHLYLKENANIILFLTHHTSAKWIIREVSSVLSQLVQHTLPLDIKRDTAVLNGWVTKTARLIVDASDVENNRVQQRNRDDEVSKIPEKEPKEELASISDLDYVSQLNLLFKTSEILGQILKNRYGSLDKKFKHELMGELFNGPLRGINFFLRIINEAPEAMMEEISSKICLKLPSLKKIDADKLAQKFIFQSVGTMADGLLARQGEIIGSPKLRETIGHVCQQAELEEAKKNGTYKLVSIAAQLSYPGSPPIAAIEEYAAIIKDNVFGSRLLQGVVARHLYMFSLPYNERQRLADAGGVSVSAQNSIALRSAEVKKLPGRTHKPTHSKNLVSRLQDFYLLKNKDVTERVLKQPQKTTSNSKTED